VGSKKGAKEAEQNGRVIKIWGEELVISYSSCIMKLKWLEFIFTWAEVLEVQIIRACWEQEIKPLPLLA